MFKRSVQLLLVAGLTTGTLWAASDPFVGEWKLNASKSKFFDQMKVESIAGNKYAFDLGGGSQESIVVDGTDQPGFGGTTLSVTSEAPDSWKVVRKKDGRVLLTAFWKLSNDRNTLTDEFTSFAPSGSSSTVNLVYKRTAGGSGFAGTWENTTGTVDTGDSDYVIKVEPYEGDGFTFIYSSERVTKNVKLDGKDYPNVGSDARPRSTSSARRVNERTLELIDKANGKVARTREITLSSDGKTLTMTDHMPGRSQPNVLVFERQ
jgi:hypothetical protein